MVSSRKVAARRNALAVRSGRNDIWGLSTRLAAALKPLLREARSVAAYVPVAGEPGLPPQTGWLLPVLLPDGDLDWAAYDGRLVPGRHGLQEPSGPRLGVTAVSACDLVLVPALLVDRRGHRLGRGGGGYDRALPRTTGLRIALLHDGELVDEVPVEPHDVRVHAAATPSLGVQRLWAG